MTGVTESQAVGDALDTIMRDRLAKVAKDQSNLAVQKLLEDGFLTKGPKGTRRIGSKMLAQATLKFVNRFKPMDFSMFCDGQEAWKADLVTAGIATVMRLGGYISSLRDKGGAFNRLSWYGDGLVMVGANPDDDSPAPIVFMPISNDKMYWDPFASMVRGPWGLSATRAVAIFSYDRRKAKELYPQMSDDCHGRIPTNGILAKDLDRKAESRSQLLSDEIEVAHYFDISENAHLVFAGSGCEVLEFDEGEDYPFMFHTANGKEEAYIPVLDFYCFPASEGIRNHGVGELLYDFAVASRMLLNMGLNHGLDVADPLWNINLPQGTADKLSEKMRAAQESRSKGFKGFVTTEYDPNAPGANQVSVNPLMAGNDFNGWSALCDRLDRELRRFGIFLDEQDYSSSPNQMEIMAKDDAQVSTVKQIQEWNASEYEMAVLVTMEMIKRYIKKSDKTPMNITVPISAEGVEIKPMFMTLGMVAEELRAHDWFPVMDSRNGAYPSKIMEMAGINDLIPMSQPGSKAWASLLSDKAKLNNRNFKGEDFGVPSQPMPTQGANPRAASTDKVSILPSDKGAAAR